VIEPKQVRQRASKLYYDIKRRSEPKLWKNGRLKGRTRWAGVPVPYSSEAFATWLLTEIGCNAFLCPYCKAPIDVLSMTLDHDVALHSGGTNEFNNLVACCADCNTLKGKLTGDQYRDFRALLRLNLDPAAEAEILQRLRSGAMGMRLSQQMRAQKANKLQPSLATSDEPF
jgi:5-methylcytosine-specific restriction endonuclease McrA